MSKQTKVVYTLTRKEKKTYWHRIGTAFVNKDGSLNVILFALPVNGELHIRDARSKDESEAAAA